MHVVESDCFKLYYWGGGKCWERERERLDKQNFNEHYFSCGIRQAFQKAHVANEPEFAYDSDTLSKIQSASFFDSVHPSVP